ncbi:paraquat-inducible protein A [Sinimarinibacterium sp. NLF-5-8]|uniref:paraquat-inducible protein A n=1 Tax=Sinimarinibacterium sp. NLF-5-8 TaxID=2698684 RepID=UPI00137B9D96|nr:paraquat-inducible protein A [Sinimarinibacterium sp. NLF-5-8]QHS09691.1 paraquat-inducible membrane protein A [Sinimarinibacterium sp. NLF-5-8]
MNRIHSARQMGLLSCHGCGAIYQQPRRHQAHLYCRRCGVHVCSRRPGSLAISWAMLIAAAILYIPANTLTMMRTTSLLEDRFDTILSGVVALWQGGSPEIAIIVFVASIVVPVAKIIIMAVLLISVQLKTTWKQPQRARLYRFIEIIGYWSMLDVFVVALLVGLVHFRGMAEVLPGGAAIAFAAVVVLTMISTLSFDPRMIWDTDETDSENHE